MPRGACQGSELPSSARAGAPPVHLSKIGSLPTTLDTPHRIRRHVANLFAEEASDADGQHESDRSHYEETPNRWRRGQKASHLVTIGGGSFDFSGILCDCLETG